MSDQKDDKWEMPKPVFRSSTGELPKTLQKTISGYNMPKMNTTDPEEDGDILSVHEHPPGDVPKAAGEEILETGGHVPAPPPTPVPVAPPAQAKTEPIKVSAAKPQPKKRAGIGTFILIFLLIAALAAGLVYALIFYLRQSTSSGPF